MANVLVSLVSDQTIPNLLLIKEFQNIDRYVLISTEVMERKQLSDAIIKASGISPKKFEKVVVREDHLEDIAEQMRPLFAPYDASGVETGLNVDDEFLVNLTGGTKIMSIGAYNYFKDYGSRIFYIPIGRNLYSQIFPRTTKTEIPIRSRVTLPEYLTAYNVTIKSPEKIHNLVKPQVETKDFFRAFLHATHQEKSLLSQLREYRNVKVLEISKVPGLEPVLDQLQFSPAESGRLSKNEIKYLTGEWLEEYFLSIVNDFHQLSPPYYGIGFEISRGTTSNEFDVMMILNNTLHVFECKTSVFSSEKSTLWNDTLYKLQALRKDFGLAAKAYIVTLNEIGDARGEIKLDRSELFGIQVIDRKMLESPEALTSVLSKMG